MRAYRWRVRVWRRLRRSTRICRTRICGFWRRTWRSKRWAALRLNLRAGAAMRRTAATRRFGVADCPMPRRAPTTISNEYFNRLFEEEWVEKKWKGPRQFEDKATGKLMMLPTDMVNLTDPEFRKYSQIS